MHFNVEALLHNFSQVLERQLVGEFDSRWRRVVHRQSNFVGLVRVTTKCCFPEHDLHHRLGLQACGGRPKLHCAIANISDHTKSFQRLRDKASVLKNMEKHIVGILWQMKLQFRLKPCAPRFLSCEQLYRLLVLFEHAFCEVVPSPQNSFRGPLELPGLSANYISESGCWGGLGPSNTVLNIAEMDKSGHNWHIHYI